MKQHPVAFAACLALAAGVACQTRTGPHVTTATPDDPRMEAGPVEPALGAAMPVDPRQPLTEIKKARFQAAVTGISFDDGLYMGNILIGGVIASTAST